MLIRLRGCAGWSASLLFAYAKNGFSQDAAQTKSTFRVVSRFVAWIHMSRLMTKPTMWLCAQRRLRSAWASAKSDQGLRCPHEECLLGSLVTHWAHSEDSDQTGRMPRLIWVFAGRTVILLVLSCGGSYHIPLYQRTLELRVLGLWVIMLIIEPGHEKNCLRCLRPVETQTGLLSYID